MFKIKWLLVSLVLLTVVLMLFEHKIVCFYCLVAPSQHIQWYCTQSFLVLLCIFIKFKWLFQLCHTHSRGYLTVLTQFCHYKGYVTVSAVSWHWQGSCDCFSCVMTGVVWLFQLCHDRRYLVTQDELDQTLETFKETYGDKPRYLFYVGARN